MLSATSCRAAINPTDCAPFSPSWRARQAYGGCREKKRIDREPLKHQIGAQNMVEQHAAQVLENIGRRQGLRPAGRRRRGRSSPRGLTSATNGVLFAPGFRDRGFGDCCCRLGRPVAYFDGTLKVFHQPYLPAIRNGSVEPLPDRPGPRAQFERRRDEFLPRDLTLLHAAARYTM